MIPVDISDIVTVTPINEILHENECFQIVMTHTIDDELWPFWDDENHILIRADHIEVDSNPVEAICLDENFTTAKIWEKDEDADNMLTYSPTVEGFNRLGDEICDYRSMIWISSASYRTFKRKSGKGLFEIATGRIIVPPIYDDLTDISSEYIFARGRENGEESLWSEDVYHRNYGFIVELPFISCAKDMRGRYFCHSRGNDTTVLEIRKKSNASIPQHDYGHITEEDIAEVSLDVVRSKRLKELIRLIDLRDQEKS